MTLGKYGTGHCGAVTGDRLGALPVASAPAHVLHVRARLPAHAAHDLRRRHQQVRQHLGVYTSRGRAHDVDCYTGHQQWFLWQRANDPCADQGQGLTARNRRDVRTCLDIFRLS